MLDFYGYRYHVYIDKYTSLMDLPGIGDRKSWTFLFLDQKIGILNLPVFVGNSEVSGDSILHFLYHLLTLSPIIMEVENG